MTRWNQVLCACALAIVGVVGPVGPASANLLPIAELEGRWFPVETDGVQLVAAIVDAEQQPGHSGGTEWWVDIELLVRNNRDADVRVPFAIPVDPAFTDDWEVSVRGVPVSLRELTLGHDPDLRSHVYQLARRIDVDFGPLEEVTVRISGRAAGTIDSLGRVFLELPTHALGLFAANVSSGRIAVDWSQRPLGLQATIDGGTVYDEPAMRTTWHLSDWAPAIPFRASTLPPWSALQLVAAVEECPDPWRIVRDVAGGNLENLRAQLGPLDQASREFCGRLPGILHGETFESEAVRAQLSEMTLGRYLGSQDRDPIYLPNPSFHVASLTEAEGIYARALASSW